MGGSKSIASTSSPTAKDVRISAVLKPVANTILVKRYVDETPPSEVHSFLVTNGTQISLVRLQTFIRRILRQVCKDRARRLGMNMYMLVQFVRRHGLPDEPRPGKIVVSPSRRFDTVRHRRRRKTSLTPKASQASASSPEARYRFKGAVFPDGTAVDRYSHSDRSFRS